MSSLEAQLLGIIEEQQQQLKQQQQQQEKALKQLEEQQKALGLHQKALQQLEDYTAILLKKSEEEVQIVKRYQEIVKKTLRADSLRAFFRGFTERIGDRFKDACDEIGEFFRRTRRIEKLVKGDFAEPGASRNREANEATGEPNQRENELSSSSINKS